MNDIHEFNPESVKKALGSPWSWILLLVVLIGGIGAYSVRIGQVSGEQVGIKLNKLNGEMTVIQESGSYIYNGITERFFVLNKTIQTLEMSQDASRGDRLSDDSLKIKTIDGSDVYVQLKVQYKIDPNMAEVVITSSGVDDAFKKKWARDYMRALCRDRLGELTTEEFYDSSARMIKVADAKREANERLKKFGIIIDSIVIPARPKFYSEYEEMIKRKKLADQAVREEESKALAASQRQERLKIEEETRKQVAVEEFTGKMERKLIDAEAEAEKTRQQAQAYAQQVRLGADAYENKIKLDAEAQLYSNERAATGTLAVKKAEAEGVAALCKALSGDGGRSMVMLEYAKKLANVKINGQPFSIDAQTRRLQHSGALPAVK